MAYKIKKRCIRCLKVLREDGTCGNEKCSRYTPEKPKEENSKETAGKANKDNTSDSEGSSDTE